MANALLGQILGSVFANAMRWRTRGDSFSAGPSAAGGGLGDVLGGMLGRGAETSRTRSGLGGQGALIAMLLPFAMQWIQRNGGIGAVLERFRQKGYGQHAQSWISTGPNQTLQADAVNDIVGGEELSRLAHQFGVPEQEVAHGFAEIFPEMIDQLSPGGQIPPEADDALQAGQSALERELSQLTTSAPI